MPRCRSVVGGVLAALVASSAAAAPAAGACDLKLNVTDQDPAGLNVRAAPAGAVIARLKAKDQWVQVHVTAQSGAWARIDDAGVFLNNEGAPSRLFHGIGYVAFSKLGVEYLDPGAPILAAPDPGARQLAQLPRLEEGQMPKGEVLGCSGDFIQVRVNGIVGWTRYFCSNQYTTCV